MIDLLRERFLSGHKAFDHPVTAWLLGTIVAALAISWLATLALGRLRFINEKTYTEVMSRLRSWILIIVALLAPVILGPGWVMVGVCLLSLLCYQEFARATGLFREKLIGTFVVIGIALVTFSVFDNFDRLFFASASFTVGLIAIGTIPQDRPKGFLQRVALASLGFLLFGFCFGYLGHFANYVHYRPILIFLFLAVELNDVFAFCAGKMIGGPKALPNTSPGKTWAGCIGALIATTLLVLVLGHFVFAGTRMDHWLPLLIFGVGLSVLGQFGDLLLSSIKRDVGIKDIGHAIPGHGGLLDRFDSMVLVPPVAFHFLGLYLGPIGLDQPQRILTGG